MPPLQPQFSPVHQLAQFPIPADAIMPNTRKYLYWALGPIAIILLPFMFIFSIFSDEYFFFEFFSMFFFIILGAGIAYLIYTYLNFKEFRDLTYLTHGYVPNLQSPGIMILALFFFPPITYYFKYKQLHEHLTLFHGEFHNLPPSGGQIVMFQLVFYFGGFFFLPLLFLFMFSPFIAIILMFMPFFIFFYFENRWQKVMNNHIFNHRGH
jgi:hypothetical protein